MLDDAKTPRRPKRFSHSRHRCSRRSTRQTGRVTSFEMQQSGESLEQFGQQTRDATSESQLKFKPQAETIAQSPFDKTMDVHFQVFKARRQTNRRQIATVSSSRQEMTVNPAAKQVNEASSQQQSPFRSTEGHLLDRKLRFDSSGGRGTCQVPIKLTHWRF